jgi:hypothetical protein
VLPRVCGCGGVVRSTPVAQTKVLRRVLTGGISTNSGCLFSCPDPVRISSSEGGPGTVPGRGWSGFVFGTLLGPETTGPCPWRCSPLGGGLWCGFCVSGFLAASITWFVLLWRGVCGVCGTGLLFENYIVDASIFYKKQFPRNMNLDLCRGAGCALFGGVAGVVVWFPWFSRELLLDLLWSSF